MNMTVEQLRSRSRFISNELRQVSDARAPRSFTRYLSPSRLHGRTRGLILCCTSHAQLNQLRRYETSGAVLTADQSARLDNGTSLIKELEELRLAIRTTAEEVDSLMAAAQQ
jgi:hypothetical protein